MKHKLMWLLFNKEASAAVADAYDFCARILA